MSFVPASSLRTALGLAASRYESRVDAAASYLTARGLSRDSWISARLGYVTSEDADPGHPAGRLAIPYITPTGIVDIKFRCVEPHSCKEHKHAKYLYHPGSVPRLYNVCCLEHARDEVAITEGELDALALCEAGFAAVAYPGVSSWRPAFARVFSGFGLVRVIADGDDPGKESARTVAKELSRFADRVTVVTMPNGEDASSVWASSPEQLKDLIKNG